MGTKHSTKKRPKEQYDAVIEMAKTETNMSVIAKKFNLPWATVRNWLRRPSKSERYPNQTLTTDDEIKTHIINNIGINEYSYMLGCYFGDGCILFIPNKPTKRFSLYTNTNTPQLIDFQSKILTYFGNKIVIKKRTDGNCVEIYTHNSNFDKIFPHTGKGQKHNRKIELTQWQKEIINYKYVLMGLYHTDGSATKAYSSTRDNVLRYEFVNVSEDIINIYCQCLDKYDINYTVVNKLCESKDKDKIHKALKVMCKQTGSDKMYELFKTKFDFSENIFKDFDMTKIQNDKIRAHNYIPQTPVEKVIPPHLKNIKPDTPRTKELLVELRKYYNNYECSELLGISAVTFVNLCSELGITKQKYTHYK